MTGEFLIAAAVLAGIGLVLGVLIAVAVRIFKVETDPRIEAVAELLPGANCGGCGLAGCADFARNVVAGRINPAQCVAASQETRSAIARVLGVELTNSIPMVAVVCCSGSKANTLETPLYNGIADCVSASLVAGGPKACSYGCLGLSSCARACSFGAISVIDGLAVVDPALCVGCGHCAEICPRHVIKLVPAASRVDIYCSSPAKAADKRKVCASPCLGCRKCAKAFPDNFTVDGFKAAVNYDCEKELPPDAVERIGCISGCLQLRSAHRGIVAGKEK